MLVPQDQGRELEPPVNTLGLGLRDGVKVYGFAVMFRTMGANSRHQWVWGAGLRVPDLSSALHVLLEGVADQSDEEVHH